MAALHTGLDSGRSWLVAAAAALSMFAVFGVAYSFGAFFSSMSEEFGTSNSATAVVFSITISLSFVLGLWTGRWADRVGPRRVLVAGAISLASGLLLTSIAQSIVVGYFTYGIGVGFAVACGYVPMVAAVSSWFERRRATALGLAVAGIGLGTLVGSPVAAALIAATSWRTTYVIFAVFGGASLLLASVVAEPGPLAVSSTRPRPLIDLLRIREFLLLYLSTAFITFGVFVPFVFLATYAEERGTGEVAAALLVGLIGGSSVIGRLGLGALADRFGTLRLYMGSFVVMSVSHLIWLVAGASYGTLLLYTVVLGIGYGGFIALLPAVAAGVFGIDGLGGVLGTLYTSAAIGSFAGPVVAGLLIDGPGTSAAIVFAALMSAAATGILWQLVQAADT